MNQCRIDLNQDNMIATFASPQFYGDTEVYIRELLQNALDACNTRAAFEWSWGTEFLEMEEARALNSMREPFHAKIRITYSSLNQRLTIEDNGIGMNGGDIEKYVSKIGQSYYKSEDFAIQRLQYEPIARYGVGMLSCFMVARAILIESKKDKCVNTAWNITNKESLEPVMAKWLEGSDTIEYVNSNREESGSKITLVLKPKYAMKLTMQTLVGGIRKCMLYQPFPIEVIYDQRREVLYDSNRILDNPFADVLGIISIRILDELMEGYLWIYNSKHKALIGESCLYQQGLKVMDDPDALGIKPEWLRHMTFHLNIKKPFLTPRMARDGVAHDEKLKELRRIIGQYVLKAFAQNPMGLNQYLNDGSQPVLTEYEEEMTLLGKAVGVDVYLKGRSIELPIETIVQGFAGNVIRIAFISKGLFEYYRVNHPIDFRRFLKENKLIVFEKNRDIFCQMMAPYRKSQRYVISEYPGILYDDMVVDFHMIRSVVPYRNSYSLYPSTIGYDDIFCLVTNNQGSTLDILLNKEHRLYKMLEPVMYHPKVHAMMAVILENIKQRIINFHHGWSKIVDFGGSFVDDWDPSKIATVQATWCLENDFVISVNEFIESRLTNRERAELGLIGFEFHRDDFINWWFMPRE